MSDYDKLIDEIFEQGRLALELSDRGEIEIHLTPQQWLILYAEFLRATGGRGGVVFRDRLTAITPYGFVTLVKSDQ